jgi:alginate O-acetyltransferase complex protein AlgI
MLFNSLEFAIFFPIVSALYFVLPYRFRTLLLLVASCIFYMAFIPAYILILAVTILIDYTAGIYLNVVRGKWRTLLLWISIAATCAVLFIFKYYDFFNDNFVGLAGLAGWELSPSTFHIILPIGLSFHTFQSLSYVVEVYRGRQKPEYNFVTYATYVMFFPQLVAGPIERPQNLLHQFYEEHRFDYERVTSGLKRMAWGFFKKLVVADRLALYVNDVYAAPQNFNGLQLTIATVFFAYQIYCDFSAYSDIAIGSARVLGFKLMENFDTPYYSRSISEFWRRWHISLSSWFRDYVYVPLGGSRVPRWRWCFNLLVTFGISGLWHGANWTYVIWGLINGIYLIASGFTGGLRNAVMGRAGLPESSALRHVLSVLATFLLVCVGWVFFRAQNLGDAFYILGHFWRDWNLNAISTPQFLLRQMPVAIAAIAFLEIGQLLHGRIPFPKLVVRTPMPWRWAGYTAFMLSVVLFGVYRNAQFIYFQF